MCLSAVAAERKASTVDIGGVTFTPSLAAPTPQPEQRCYSDDTRQRFSHSVSTRETRPRGFTLAQRRQLREAMRVERRDQRRLGGFIVCSDDSEDEGDLHDPAVQSEETDTPSVFMAERSVSLSSSDSDSTSESESDSESDSEDSDSTKDARRASCVPSSPIDRAERLHHILANSPALVKRKQQEEQLQNARLRRRARRRATIADAVIEQAVGSGLRRVPDELRRMQAMNYSAVSSLPQQHAEEDEAEDHDLNIDAVLGKFDLTTDDSSCKSSAATTSVRPRATATQTSTLPMLSQMRVIKRAKLRVSSARDSATCGYLDVGTVIDVLERATPVQERVRCAQGWLSVTSSSGNTLLEPIGGAETSLDSQQAELIGDGDVDSWSDIWPSYSRNMRQPVPQEQQEQKKSEEEGEAVQTQTGATDSEPESSQRLAGAANSGRRLSRRLASKRQLQPLESTSAAADDEGANLLSTAQSGNIAQVERAKRRRQAADS